MELSLETIDEDGIGTLNNLVELAAYDLSEQEFISIYK